MLLVWNCNFSTFVTMPYSTTISASLLVSLLMCKLIPLHKSDLVCTFVFVFAWKFVPIFEIPPCEFAITCIFPCVATWRFPPLSVLVCTFAFVCACACALVLSCGYVQTSYMLMWDVNAMITKTFHSTTSTWSFTTGERNELVIVYQISFWVDRLLS
jgi:hypothetical protein